MIAVPVGQRTIISRMGPRSVTASIRVILAALPGEMVVSDATLAYLAVSLPLIVYDLSTKGRKRKLDTNNVKLLGS